MKNWKEANIEFQEKMKKKYGVDSLNIPMFSLQQFDYNNRESIQNKKIKAIGRFQEKRISIDYNDHLSGYFDGNKMHCFYRTSIPKEYTREFEYLLKKYDILYEKETYRENNLYACDIAKIEMNDIKNISSYPESSSFLKSTLKNLSKKLINKII